MPASASQRGEQIEALPTSYVYRVYNITTNINVSEPIVPQMIHNMRMAACCALLAGPAAACSEPAPASAAASSGAAPSAAALPAGSDNGTVATQQGIPRLTMDNISRYYQALTNIFLVAKAHPEVGPALSINASESDAQNIAKINAIPAAVDALHRAGITPAQYLAIAGTLAGSMIGSEVATPLPAGVVGDNMRFVKQHHA